MVLLLLYNTYAKLGNPTIRPGDVDSKAVTNWTTGWYCTVELRILWMTLRAGGPLDLVHIALDLVHYTLDPVGRGPGTPDPLSMNSRC